MLSLKSPRDIAKLRTSNVIVAEVLAILKEKVQPGITTMDLELIAEEECKKRNVRPAFKGYHGFQHCLCTSVNTEVVHGIPSNRVLDEGDILSIDFGVECEGFYGDSAVTLPVGKVSADAERLMDVTKVSLDMAIEAMRKGNLLKDIAAAVQRHVEGNGYSVVRAFVGHGIGKALHEAPQVPNFVTPGLDLKLKPGMVLAIEPMVSAGDHEVKVLKDGWTAVTKDASLSAHFEHSVAITQNGPFVLSKL